jgi:signal transduction histidine kinase
VKHQQFVNFLSSSARMNQALSPAYASNTVPWLEAAAFGLLLCDAQLTVLHANGRCGEMLNLAQEHMGGRHLFDLLELPDAQRTLALQELERSQTWQGLARSENRALKVDVRGTGAGAVVSLIDYSADLEHLQKLTDAKTLAEKSNEAKSQFLQHMSHELRTPLNAIIGFTQLLKISAGLDAVERDNVAEIEKAGESLLVLINEILDLSKIEAGKLRLSEGHVDLGTLVKECLQLATPMAAPRGIQIDTRIASDTLLLADHVRLKQILMNLLSNAIKYNCGDGTVVLQSINVADNKLRLEIRDSGAGIAPEHLQTIFSPFDRIGSIEGSGIGLMITRRLVALMEGEIGVVSLPGRGSVFWVELPRKRLSILESMLLLSGTDATATGPNVNGPVFWIGERTPLFAALEALREARPALILRRYASVATLGALANEVPGVVLLSEDAAREVAQMHELPKALKGARLHVVMDSRERRTPLASLPFSSLWGQSVLPVSEDSKLPALLDLLDSPGQKSHELMKGQEPGLNKP